MLGHTSSLIRQTHAGSANKMIKYLGSKRTLIPTLLDLLAAAPQVRSAVDLFSGTSRVGHALKGAGLQVHSNDHNTYAHTLARCYVAADREQVERDAQLLIDELNELPGAPGYFTEVFCEQSRFSNPRMGRGSTRSERRSPRKIWTPCWSPFCSSH